MSFRVPMREVEVEIALNGVPAEHYIVYLAPFSDRHDGGETMEEYLNGSRRFYPGGQDGTPRILNREQILWIRTPEEGSFLEGDETMIRKAASVELTDGVTFEGMVRIDKPLEQSRLSDVLNDPNQLFLRLEMDAATLYVQKRFIRVATPK